MNAAQINAFVTAAVADGWALTAAHAKSPVPKEQMGVLTLHKPHGPADIQIEFSSLDKDVSYEHVFADGRKVPHTYKKQHRMRGANANGHWFDPPVKYDLDEIRKRAASAKPE